MGELISVYFLETGMGWAMIGAAAAMMLGCSGSARGIRVAAGQAAGVMSEKPELFGKLLVLMALPGTQGFYGFIVTVMVVLRCGVLGNAVAVTPVAGVGIMAIGIGAGVAMMKSAVFQGETSAACINLTARRPEQGGKAILMPALVETYAVVALLAAILVSIWLTPDAGMKYHPEKNKPAVAEVKAETGE
ncbi:MAG: V-type ATP synthase subunit K [Planctomycetota bacterium]|jgi:V/A-type H+-transporting ATPase subunit K